MNVHTTMSRRACAVALLAGALSLPAAGPPQVEWIRQFNFGVNQFEAVRALAADASGVYAGGEQGLPQAPDAFVQKRDRAGNVVWNRLFGTIRGDSVSAIARDQTGLYVGGWAGASLPGQTFVGGDDDAFVRRYDLDGNEVWTRQFGSKTPGIENYGRDHVLGLSLTDDAVYLVGASEGPLPGQTWQGDWDAFVRKYDKNGVEQWTRQFGTAYGESVNSVAADATGIYVFGHGGAPVDRWPVFVRKYDHSGNLLWHQVFGDPLAFQGPGGIAVDPSGVYAYGTTRGTIPGQTSAGGEDNFIRKFTTSGAVLWTRQFGTSAQDNAGGIALDAHGLYVVGTTWGTFPGQTNAGGADALVQSFDPDGNERWTLQFGTSANDPLSAVAAGVSGLYVGAYTNGTFPGQTGGGGLDAFVAKLQRAPTVNAGPDLTVGSSLQSGYILSGSAIDPDNDLLLACWFEGTTALTPWLAVGTGGTSSLDISTLSLGQHTLTLKATDGFFVTADSTVVQIVDDEPPVLAPTASRTTLWPPNHQMVPVNVMSNIIENGSGPVSLVASVTSNEPANGLGDGDTSPDWELQSINQGTGAIALLLRAERAGTGSGRIYTITLTATDAAGNVGQAQVMVLVPLILSKP